MKAALLSLALFGTGLMTPVSDRVPELNVDALCKARSAEDKLMRFPELQSVADCVHEETDAKQNLRTLWGTTPGSIRARCESDAVALGTRTYLDLLTCIQMADDVKWPSPTASMRGAGKRGNAK
jgi:hypothetical protein